MSLLRAQGGDFSEALFAERAQVHRCTESEERVIGADIRCSPLAFDVLLTRLKGQDICSVPAFVARLAYDATGNFSHVFIACGEHAKSRPPERRRDTQALGLTGNDICAAFTR